MLNKVLIFTFNKKSKRFAKEAKKITLKALEILKKNNALIEIYPISGRKMRFLNKKFRGKDKNTSILSFKEPRNFIFPPSGHKKIGEIYLKLPITSYPLTQLLVHGLLHLFGYDHQRKSDRIRMEKREQQILESLQ